MITTSYEYRIPETDDKDFWGSYNFNWLRVAIHRHDNLDSVKLNPYAIITTELTIPFLAAWTADGSRFKNTVEVPVGYTMPDWTTGRPPLAFSVVDANGSPQANEVGPGSGQQIIVYSPFIPTADLFLLFG